MVRRSRYTRHKAIVEDAPPPLHFFELPANIRFAIACGNLDRTIRLYAIDMPGTLLARTDTGDPYLISTRTGLTLEMDRIIDKSAKFLQWHELASRSARNTAQPVEHAGKIWHGVRETARKTGLSPAWITTLARRELVRYIRVPRGPDDLRAPIYYDVESVEEYKRERSRKAE